jgi:hypothetical protein
VLVKDRFIATNSNMIGLVETKLPVMKGKGTKLEKWLSNGNMSWIEVPSRKQNSGGLFLAWDNHYFSKTKSSEGDIWIFVEGRLIQENMDVSFLLVYAPNAMEDRSPFYKELKELSISHPLMVFDDFNEIRKLGERKNNCNTAPTPGMIEFEAWINDMKLFEIPVSRINFTWYSLSHKNDKASWIDRVFVHKEWNEHFKIIKVWGLETSRSDHSYILIVCNSKDLILFPFIETLLSTIKLSIF